MHRANHCDFLVASRDTFQSGSNYKVQVDGNQRFRALGIAHFSNLNGRQSRRHRHDQRK